MRRRSASTATASPVISTCTCRAPAATTTGRGRPRRRRPWPRPVPAPRHRDLVADRDRPRCANVAANGNRHRPLGRLLLCDHRQVRLELLVDAVGRERGVDPAGSHPRPAGRRPGGRRSRWRAGGATSAAGSGRGTSSIRPTGRRPAAPGRSGPALLEPAERVTRGRVVSHAVRPGSRRSPMINDAW